MSWYIKKCLDTPIIIGGPAPTFDKKLSQEASPFDAICIGDSSSMRYPDDVKRFLTPFQRLFPLFVMFPSSLEVSSFFDAYTKSYFKNL